MRWSEFLARYDLSSLHELFPHFQGPGMVTRVWGPRLLGVPDSVVLVQDGAAFRL